MQCVGLSLLQGKSLVLLCEEALCELCTPKMPLMIHISDGGILHWFTETNYHHFCSKTFNQRRPALQNWRELTANSSIAQKQKIEPFQIKMAKISNQALENSMNIFEGEQLTSLPSSMMYPGGTRILNAVRFLCLEADPAGHDKLLWAEMVLKIIILGFWKWLCVQFQHNWQLVSAKVSQLHVHTIGAC